MPLPLDVINKALRVITARGGVWTCQDYEDEKIGASPSRPDRKTRRLCCDDDDVWSISFSAISTPMGCTLVSWKWPCTEVIRFRYKFHDQGSLITYTISFAKLFASPISMAV